MRTLLICTALGIWFIAIGLSSYAAGKKRALEFEVQQSQTLRIVLDAVQEENTRLKDHLNMCHELLETLEPPE